MGRVGRRRPSVFTIGHWPPIAGLLLPDLDLETTVRDIGSDAEAQQCPASRFQLRIAHFFCFAVESKLHCRRGRWTRARLGEQLAVLWDGASTLGLGDSFLGHR